MISTQLSKAHLLNTDAVLLLMRIVIWGEAYNTYRK